MSNIQKGEELTTAEVALVEGLNSLAISTSTQGIQKTGANTFANVEIGGGTVGPGTINELAYFDTTTSIGSLTTATYPSLTELSYVKGVTSAIQTQIDGKIDGTMVADRIPIGVDANTLTTSANLTFNSTAFNATSSSILLSGGLGSVNMNDSNGWTNLSYGGGQVTIQGSLLTFSTTYNPRITISDTVMVVNDAGIDYDFRIEGDTKANLFFVDASADQIGIGTASPSASLHVVSTTEQQRLGYDSSNYLSVTVGSAGSTIFNLTGTSPQFSFLDPMLINNPTTPNSTDGLIIRAQANGTRDGLTILANNESQQVQLGWSELRFSSNADIRANAGILEFTVVGGQSYVFNEAGVDADFRIESDTHTDAFFLDGANGETTLGAYGGGTFVDTPAYALGVLATGEIVEFTPGVGTVSSVSFTGGLISVATATTTPALTVAGTSGGIPYFSSTSTWASSALLAANAIMIGGGAGVAPATTATGTGVLTALAINVGSAGAFVTFNGALGTPSSGTVTNLTGTASININGTVGATTPTTGVFTTATINTVLNPDTDGGAGLGSATLGFSILGLASASTINFANSNVVLTHSSGILTMGTGELRVTNAGTNTASVVTVGGTQTLTSKTLTSPTINAATLSGDIVLAEGGNVELDSVLSADGTYTGITIDGTAGTTLAFGDLVYLAAADSRWELVDADAVGTSGTVLIGLCVLAAAADGNTTKILLQGTVRADTAFPALTISAPVYAGETAGDVQTTIPTGADAVIRVVGFALTADSMYFNPSSDHQTVVA